MVISLAAISHYPVLLPGDPGMVKEEGGTQEEHSRKEGQAGAVKYHCKTEKYNHRKFNDWRSVLVGGYWFSALSTMFLLRQVTETCRLHVLKFLAIRASGQIPGRSARQEEETPTFSSWSNRQVCGHLQMAGIFCLCHTDAPLRVTQWACRLLWPLVMAPCDQGTSWVYVLGQQLPWPSCPQFFYQVSF